MEEMTVGHVLTAAEVRQDLLHVDPDLSPLAPAFAGHVHAEDGSPLRLMPAGHLRATVTRPSPGGARVIVGPRGWLSATAGDGDRVGVTLRHRTLSLQPVPAADPVDATVAERLRERVAAGTVQPLQGLPSELLGLRRTPSGRVSQPLGALLGQAGLGHRYGWAWRRDAPPRRLPTRPPLLVDPAATDTGCGLREQAVAELASAVIVDGGCWDDRPPDERRRLLRRLRDLDVVADLAEEVDGDPALLRLCEGVVAAPGGAPTWARPAIAYLLARAHLRRGRPGEALLALAVGAPGCRAPAIQRLVEDLRVSLGHDDPVPRRSRGRGRWASDVRNGVLSYLELTRSIDLVDARHVMLRDAGCGQPSSALAADVLLHDLGGVERVLAEAGHLLPLEHRRLLRSWQGLRRGWWEVVARGPGNALIVAHPPTGIEIGCTVPSGMDGGGRQPWRIPGAGTVLNARLLPTLGGPWLLGAPASLGAISADGLGDPNDLSALMRLQPPSAAA